LSELRKDPIVGRWVIISEERASRPHSTWTSDDNQRGREEYSKDCPFCEGNESVTPQEVFAIRERGSKPDEKGWDVRVVPNKFPALKQDVEFFRDDLGIIKKVSGFGIHEVIIEHPKHNLDFADFSNEHIEKILEVWKERIKIHDKDDRLKYALLFKNQGETAGASLEHSHSQLIAIPITPINVKNELQSSLDYYKKNDRCLFCDYIEYEKNEKVRVLIENKSMIAIAPYASRFPYELMIFPKNHSSDYINIGKKEIEDLADILKNILKRFETNINNPPYNLMLHTAPLRYPVDGYWETIEEDYHWHFEIFPRLTRIAGFEWGTGFYINPLSPELAVEYL
jgi:UDPglucose--hexose-1-phosphate uridylyltransferase